MRNGNNGSKLKKRKEKRMSAKPLSDADRRAGDLIFRRDGESPEELKRSARVAGAVRSTAGSGGVGVGG